MVKVFVDTSAMVVLLDADDRRHPEAVTTLENLQANTELVTTNYVQVEALAVVRRRLGADAAVDLLDSLLPIMSVIWVTEGTHATALAVFRVSAGISFVDRVSFTVMRQQGIGTAFAYDTDFQTEGFTLLGDTAAPHLRRQIHDARAAYGADVKRELVSVTEIARRSSRSINTVQSWRRRNPDFPAPVAQLAAGPIWDWSTVEAWVAARSGVRTENQTDA